jgi:HMG box factor
VQRVPMSPRWQFLLKLDMLRAISPPLQPPGSGAAPFETRGPIIAIEGLSPSNLKEVTAVVEKALSVSGECAVKLWADNESRGENANGTALDNNEEGEGLLESPLSKYVAEMLKWHHTSGELIKYITRSPSLASNPSTNAGSNSNTAENDNTQTQLPSRIDSHTASESTNPQPSRLPIAVISTGYSLTISDRYAASLPIKDAYRSEDHWRWVATLWRGIVGPDLTVYVKQRCSEDEIRGNNCVEFVNASVLVLRIAEGARGVDEKLERRLGFEIMEWVRNGNFGKRD